MSQIRVSACLALLALATVASTADAQVNSDGRVREGAAIEACQAAPGSSRARRNCEPARAPASAPAPAPTARETPIATEAVPLPTSRQCEAAATMEYFQRNTSARVASKISVATCPAATGTFTIVLRIKDASGEIKPVEFNETWQRADAKDVSFSADYPIGDNVELTSARVRGLRCTCDDPAQPATN